MMLSTAFHSSVRGLTTVVMATLALWFWVGSGVRGNDTGGIIPWSPENQDAALALASDHCGRYDKFAVVTSIHPWPGDYISFVCRRDGRWGPRKR